ncbi:MAG: LysR family transcriptional regulator [Cognatishimia sp.]|uniref:LysR family transcriptional regulator n=1 Tax=Cognatishimia sp. TaxID=2211648 RepID=UPI003B8B3312
MNWGDISYDWNHVRAFLAVVEEGSLSGAARKLKLTQPTLSRQIGGFEEELGLTLFLRGTRRMELTEAGTALLEDVRQMTEAATRIALVANGQSDSISGTVRISCSDAMAAYIMPGIIAVIRDRYPDIHVDLRASNDVSDLLRREADIAVRHIRPEQPELIAKKLGNLSPFLYGTKTYLNTIGPVESPADLSKANFVGYESAERFIPQFKALGMSVDATNFKITTMDGVSYFELARRGLGIAILPKEYAERFAEFQCVLPQVPLGEMPVWLTTHRDLHTNMRIRLVYDVLSEELLQQSSQS